MVPTPLLNQVKYFVFTGDIMMQVIKAVCFGAIASAMISGCATVQDPGQKAFLSDYTKLEEIAENQLVFDSGKLDNYSKFIIEPVAMLYRAPEEKRIFETRNSRTFRYTSQPRYATR